MTSKAIVLHRVRESLQRLGLHALVVPHTDAHQSEYLARRDERLAFVSGFTGSSGTAVVTNDRAYCWTDNRYFIQAEEELDKSVWTLMKIGEKDVPGLESWLATAGSIAGTEESSPTTTTTTDATQRRSKRRKTTTEFIVGVDAHTSSIRFAQSLIKEINSASTSLPKGAKRTEIRFLHDSLIDQIWGNERPERSGGPVTSQPLSLTGMTSSAKLDGARVKAKAKGVDSIFVNSLDDIAWALNLRGQDIPYNPLFFAHLLVDVHENRATLFTDSELPSDAFDLLKNQIGLQIESYDAVTKSLKNIPLTKKVWIDPSTCSVALHEVLSGSPFVDSITTSTRVFLSTNPFKLTKPVKSKEEKEGMIRAQRIDALALSRFFSWLDTQSSSSSSKGPLDEFALSDKLEEFRKDTSGDSYLGPSFPTIASFGPNGAIVHYRPKKGQTSRLPDLINGDVFLCDSGGQYRDGTTDTTRTIWMGLTTSGPLFDKAKRAYTGVLKGHINLATAIFPSGISPHRLDSLSRAPLWSLHMDFKHGVGHGVGAYGPVHELPPLISSSCPANHSDAKEFKGMIENVCVTNEPGVYIEGEFGIRIESLLFVVKTEHKDFCAFETITHVPLCRSLIDPNLLSLIETKWIDEYHRQCREKLTETAEGARLNEDEREILKTWIEKQTRPLMM